VTLINCREDVRYIFATFLNDTQNFGPIDANNNEESISEIWRSLIPVRHVKRGVQPILKSDIPSLFTVRTGNDKENCNCVL
jgi:hypothetical protein